MKFKTYINDLRYVQRAVNDISGLNTTMNGASKLFTDEKIVTKYANSISGLNKQQALLALSTKNLSNEQKQQILSEAGLISSEKQLTASQISERLATELGSAADAKSLLIKSGLITEKELEQNSTIKVTAAKLEEAIANGVLSATDANIIATTLGITGANFGSSISFDILTASILENIKAMLVWLATNPAGQAMLLGGVFLGLVGIVKSLTTSTEEYKEQLDDLKNEYNEITSEIQSVNSELETTIDRMNELEGKDSLTFTEKEEYDNLVKTNNELQRKLDLLELEEKQKNKEKNKTFVDTMESESNKTDYVIAKPGGGSRRNGITSKIEYSAEQYIEMQLESYSDNLTKIAELDEKYKDDSSNKEYLKEREKIEKENEKILKYLQNKNKEFTEVSDGIEYVDDPQSEDDKAVNEWLDYIADFQDRMAIAMGGNNAKTNAFNRLVDNWQFDDTVQSLQDLGKEGKVTVEMLTDSKYNDFINKLVEIGVIDSSDNLEDVALAFNAFSSAVENSTNSVSDKTADLRLKMISSINDLSEGFEELDKIYASILDKDAFDFKLLDDDNFKETFSTLDSYADFIETITSNPDDINACKDAFSTLVTEWITSTKILDNVTEDNEKLTAAMLKQMGVANADEVAHYALEKAKAEEHLQSEDCIDVTQASTEELLNEANAAGIDSNAFLEMVANEILFNRTDMKTEQKCQKILAIAQAAGVATTAMTTLQSQINEWANEEIGSGTRTKTAQDIGLTVKGKNDRTAEEWEKHGNLYIATDGTSFEGYEDAMYYQESLNNINKMTSAYNTLKYTGGSTSQDKEKALENSKETFDWIERAVKKVQRVITNLGKTVSATYKTWTTRNSALAQEIAEVNNELSLQQQAYNQYMAQAEAVGLSSYYKNQIQNGSLSIDSESDDTIKKQIKEYQDFYDKALSAADAVQDLQDQLAEFGKTKFQNKLAEYENELDEIEDYKKSLESIKSLLETQGYVASHNLYTSLAELEKENIENLKEEYEALTNSLNYAMENGVEKYSDDWYEMCSQIQDVNEQIISANTNLADLINQLRELDWELFDTKQNRISQITSESDWLIDLMSNKDLYDEDTGAITEQGKATLGLHAINYNTYMSQAEDYAEELLKINEQIANDPYNTTLLEHREELLESQRDMISAAEDEKQALFDLISEGYDSYLNALQEIIDKRKEAMDQIKDLYDYEKNISELNKDITILEKQEMAFRGNDSEEGMAKWQEIQASLEEARENLEETEYERYIDDQQKMLDTLYEDAEQWVNERLDNQDLLLQTVIDEANNNADSIKETLEKEVRDVGSVLSDNMMNILSPDSNVGQIVSMYGDNFNTYANTTVNTLLGIKAGVDAMLADSGLQVNTNIEALKLSNPYSTSGSGSSSATESSSTSSSTNSDSSSNGGWGSWFIAKKNSLSKSKLHIDTSIVDRLKYFDFDSSESARAKYYKSMGGSGEYYGTAKQNRWMLEQMKANGFKQGGTIGGIIKGTGEDGFILARTGEEVLSLEKIEALKDTLSMVNPLADTMAKLKIDLPDIQPRNNVVNQEFNMNFELHDVTNGEQLLDFVKNDKRFIKTIQQETIGAMMGQNSLGRYKY